MVRYQRLGLDGRLLEDRSFPDPRGRFTLRTVDTQPYVLRLWDGNGRVAAGLVPVMR